MATHNKRTYKSVERQQFVFRDVCPGSRLDKAFTVSLVCLFVDVVFFSQGTLVFFQTAVAAIRRVIKFVTYFFHILAAHVITKAASRTAFGTARLIVAQIALVTVPAVDTPVSDTVSRKLVTIQNVNSDFP